jgi:hypothetical protein
LNRIGREIAMTQMVRVLSCLCIQQVHNTDIGITEREYNILWQSMTTFILQLDVSKKDDLIRIENRPLDVALCTKYCTIILDIRKFIRMRLAKVMSRSAV